MYINTNKGVIGQQTTKRSVYPPTEHDGSNSLTITPLNNIYFLIQGNSNVTRCSTKMTDKVSIFFTNDGVEWAGYLQEKLSCKDCNIDTELVSISNKDIDFLSKVNVFLVSPDFLELESWTILSQFDSKTAIAVLAGVEHNDWTEAAAKHNEDTVLEWLDYELEASDKSVRELLVSIIGIYEIQEEFGDDHEAAWNEYMNSPPDKPNEADSFYKVLPRRPSRQLNAVTNVFRKVIMLDLACTNTNVNSKMPLFFQ